MEDIELHCTVFRFNEGSDGNRYIQLHMDYPYVEDIKVAEARIIAARMRLWIKMNEETEGE